MKKLIKNIALFTIFSLLFSTPIYAQETFNIANEIDARLNNMTNEAISITQEIALAEAPAQTLYDNLLFQLQSSTPVSYSKSNSTNINLNDYYGGAYLNDNKELTICITSNDLEIATLFREATGSSNVVIQHVNHSLDDLNNTANAYRKMLQDYQQRADLHADYVALLDNLIESYTDIFTNQFVIGINELNANKSELFWNLFDLPTDTIRLENVEKADSYATIRPGGGLYVSQGDSNYGININQSVGYRGYRVNLSGNKVYGFTGCGHGAISHLYRSGETVGSLYDYNCGGNYDLAFYDATASASLSNWTSYSDDIGNAIDIVELSTLAPTNILVGATAMKVGASTFFTSGTITSLNYNTTADGISYTNMIKTTANAAPGDSGGATFILYQNTYRIIGTVTGGNVSKGYSFMAPYTQYALESTIYRY